LFVLVGATCNHAQIIIHLSYEPELMEVHFLNEDEAKGKAKQAEGKMKEMEGKTQEELGKLKKKL
jgi:hypothetical protein